MKHPIFRNSTDRKMMKALKDFGADSLINQIKNYFPSEREARGYVARINVMAQVANCGHTLIKLSNSKDWDESLSEKTLMEMRGADILMPFPALTIDLQQAEWSGYDYVNIAKDDDKIAFVFERDEDGGMRHHVINIYNENKISDEIDNVFLIEQTRSILSNKSDNELLSQMKGSIYKCISIIMYAAMFKKDKNLVKFEKTFEKGSKKRDIPNHNTNTVYLSQQTYTVKGSNRSGEKRSKSDKTWLQRGHFRKQPYGSRDNVKYKTIWINPVWKGSGSKVVNKVYKV